MAQLANCLTCQAVFAKINSPICRDCLQKEEEAFATVYRFLMKQKNREATLMEITEATGVEKDLIIKFLKENRLRTAQLPNVNYPCEKCRKKIFFGRFCRRCAHKMIGELEHHTKDEPQVQPSKEKSSKNVYYTIKSDEK